MKNVIIEVHAGSLEEGLNQVLKEVGQADEGLQQIIREATQEFKEHVEAEGNLLKESIVALKATIKDVTRKLDHAKDCNNCGRHIEANAALAAFNAKMEAAVIALQEVIKAEEVVKQAIKNIKGVK